MNPDLIESLSKIAGTSHSALIALTAICIGGVVVNEMASFTKNRVKNLLQKQK